MNVFIGELPPPYGGVAVKDKLMYHEVYKPAGVKFLNLVECKWKPWKIPWIGFKLIWYLLIADNVIVGVGLNLRRKVIMEIRYILRGSRGLEKLRMIVMGGNIQNQTPNDRLLRQLLMKCGTLWVETNGMKENLEEQGFRNIKIYPNCRTEENALPPRPIDEEIKFVFFSRICEQKGVDEIIDTIDRWEGKWSLDFYGEIDLNYVAKFNSFLETHPNIRYHGVYDATNGTVYQELNQYDILLFPSKWIGEGVPGILVESKMAGITAIVSDWNFNSEIVRDGDEGVILKTNLPDTINSICLNQIEDLKKGSFESRKRYCTSTYRKELIQEVI